MSNRIGDIKFKIIDPIGTIKVVMLKGEKGDTYDDTDLRNRRRTQDGIIANFIEESTEQIDDLTELVGTFDGRITENTEDIAENTSKLNNLINLIYPIGSIYTSTRNVSPATFLGGTWTQIKDTFLLTAGDTYQAGTTGGEATHTLTAQEMPSHAHGLNGHVHDLAGHTHSIPSLSGSTNSTGNHVHYSKNRWAYFEGTASDPSRHDYFGGPGSILSTYSAQEDDLANNMYENGNHSHTVTTNASNTGGASGNTGGASGNTANRGDNQAHNNMPPYRVVYAWERTA